MPDSEPLPTLTREQVRALDRRAIEDYGIPSALLMENAGRACAEAALELLGHKCGALVVVMCGPGNNGGDGFVLARTLLNRGYRVEVFFVARLSRIAEASEDVQLNASLWEGLGGEIVELATSDQLAPAALRFRAADLIVDAMFGTGLTRELNTRLCEVVDASRSAKRPVLAVDVPSGLDANTGEVFGEAISATTTVSFVAAKPGFYLDRGPELCGRIVIAEIGIPRAFIEEAESIGH